MTMIDHLSGVLRTAATNDPGNYSRHVRALLYAMAAPTSEMLASALSCGDEDVTTADKRLATDAIILLDGDGSTAGADVVKVVAQLVADYRNMIRAAVGEMLDA